MLLWLMSEMVVDEYGFVVSIGIENVLFGFGEVLIVVSNYVVLSGMVCVGVMGLICMDYLSNFVVVWVVVCYLLWMFDDDEVGC